MGVTIPNYAMLYPNLACIYPYSMFVQTRFLPWLSTRLDFYIFRMFHEADSPNPVSRQARLVLPNLLVKRTYSHLLDLHSSYIGVLARSSVNWHDRRIKIIYDSLNHYISLASKTIVFFTN